MSLHVKIVEEFGFDQEELEVVYKYYVRPALGCGDVMCTKQTVDLERIQRRACRMILGHKFKSYRDAVGKCNLESLIDRPEAHRKQLAQDLSDNVRTCHLLPPSRFQSRGRNLRNSSNLSQLVKNWFLHKKSRKHAIFIFFFAKYARKWQFQLANKVLTAHYL